MATGYDDGMQGMKNPQSFIENVKKMENMVRKKNQEQKDWDQDVADPMERLMVTKEKPVKSGRGRGQRRPQANKGRGRGNWNSQQGHDRRFGSNFSGPKVDCDRSSFGNTPRSHHHYYYDERPPVNFSPRRSEPHFDRRPSPNYFPRFHQQHPTSPYRYNSPNPNWSSQRASSRNQTSGNFSNSLNYYEPDVESLAAASIGGFSSVSRGNASAIAPDMKSIDGFSPVSPSTITPSELAKSLCDFDDFEASMLTLLDQFYYNHKLVKQIAQNNSNSFEIHGEKISLRPKVKMCSLHLGTEGCLNANACESLHLCLDYVLGKCTNENCVYGHHWFTNHNQRVITSFHLNLLASHSLSRLFKGFIVSSAKRENLGVCLKYNTGECQGKACPELHMCLRNLGRLCPSINDCVLDHSLSGNQTRSLLEQHGLSLNESPRDILTNIVACPKIKETIEALTQKEPNIKKESDSSDPKQLDKDVESLPMHRDDVNQQHSTEHEKLPVKTTWCHECKGDVTISEICYDSVESLCQYEESGCWRLHCNMHYYWQVRPKDVNKVKKKTFWVNLTMDQVIALENAFCDPETTKVAMPPLDPSVLSPSEKGLLLIMKGRSKWEVDFDDMELTLAAGGSDVLELRRLCTQNNPNETTPDPCLFKWYFLDKNDVWIKYGCVDSTLEEKLKCNIRSKEIEKHFRQRPNSPMSFKNQDFSYVLDFNSMCQTNLKTNVKRKVRRRPIPHLKKEVDDVDKGEKDLPSFWDILLPEERFRKVTLSPSSSEYLKLETFIRGQGGGASLNILKIERVQNPCLWRAFQNKVRDMTTLYKDKTIVNIQQLFHGTRPDTVDKICVENFDWRLHGTSAGQMYGRGTYFSPLPSTSISYAQTDPVTSHRFMFVAQVAVGTLINGNSGMARPPMHPQYNIPYDSTCDNPPNPAIIVKYDKQEYFPEYILTLT